MIFTAKDAKSAKENLFLILNEVKSTAKQSAHVWLLGNKTLHIFVPFASFAVNQLNSLP
jgi:hypothetical protein